MYVPVEMHSEHSQTDFKLPLATTFPKSSIVDVWRCRSAFRTLPNTLYIINTTIFAKGSILDVWRDPEYTYDLFYCRQSIKYFTSDE